MTVRQQVQKQLDQFDWSLADLAIVMDRPLTALSAIISGKKSITPTTARELVAALPGLGLTAEEILHEETAEKLSREVSDLSPVKRRARIYAKAPVRELIRRGWIVGSKDLDVLEAAVCSFLGIAVITDDVNLPMMARRSNGENKPNASQIAWFARCRALAAAMEGLPKYSRPNAILLAQKLSSVVLMVEDVSAVPGLIHNAGIRLVTVQALPGGKIEGAAFWVGENQPAIAHAVRLDKLDTYLFTLAHELAHLILHAPEPGKWSEASWIDSGSESDSEQEKEANNQAAAWLIEASRFEQLLPIIRRNGYSPKSVEEAAKLLGVHPALIVGQLQKRGLIAFSRLRNYLERVRLHLDFNE